MRRSSLPLLCRWDAEQLSCLSRECGVCGDSALAERRSASGAIGKNAAGFNDYWIQSRRVPIGECSIDHHFGASGSDEEVSVAIAPSSRDASLDGEAVP